LSYGGDNNLLTLSSGAKFRLHCVKSSRIVCTSILKCSEFSALGPKNQAQEASWASLREPGTACASAVAGPCPLFDRENRLRVGSHVNILAVELVNVEK
jgi:hypothetical protein